MVATNAPEHNPFLWCLQQKPIDAQLCANITKQAQALWTLLSSSSEPPAPRAKSAFKSIDLSIGRVMPRLGAAPKVLGQSPRPAAPSHAHVRSWKSRRNSDLQPTRPEASEFSLEFCSFSYFGAWTVLRNLQLKLDLRPKSRTMLNARPAAKFRLPRAQHPATSKLGCRLDLEVPDDMMERLSSIDLSLEDEDEDCGFEA